MSGRLVRLGWLTLLWVVLWGSLTPANVLGGLAASAVLMAVFPVSHPGGRGHLRVFAAVHYLAYFVWKLVLASAIVTWEVITPGSRIKEGIIEVPLRSQSDILITTVANSVTLTPGTLTVVASRAPAVLYVHVLHLRDIESARRDIQRLEDLAIRAFGTVEEERAPRPPRSALRRGPRQPMRPG